MEASSSTRRRSSGLGAAMFSTRRGALTTAVVAAILAGLLLFAFVQNYKKSSPTTAGSTPVFVASAFIPRGTPANVIASGQLLSRTTVPTNHVLTGAISDPSVLHGEVAATDIYPGQQLTAGDFTTGDVTISSQLAANQRAIAVSVASAQGLIGFVQTGDHVDVMGSFSGNGNGKAVVTTEAQNLLVLSAPSSSGGGVTGGGGGGSNIVLQVTPKQANLLAYASDNGKIWLTLRPPADALGSTTNQANGKK